LLACYETIAEGNRQKAELEAKIAARTSAPTPPSKTQDEADLKAAHDGKDSIR